MAHADNLKQTLEAMFKIKTSNVGTFRKGQGMQFGRPYAKYLVLLFMLVLVGSFFVMINTSLLLGLLMLPLTIPIASYIIDIQGFEVDFKSDKIRKYRSFLGMHSGEWMPLSSFDSVRVYKSELKTQRGRFMNRGNKKYDAHAYYYVRLVSPGMSSSISLLELDDFHRAKYQAEKVAKHARLRYMERPAKLKEDRV